MPTGHTVERPATSTFPRAIVPSANSLSRLSQLNISDIRTKQQTTLKERKRQVDKLANGLRKTNQQFTPNRDGHKYLSESTGALTCSDGLIMAKQKWKCVVGQTSYNNHLPPVTQSSEATYEEPEPVEPSLASIIFRISQEKLHQRTTTWPNPNQGVTPDVNRKTAPRKLRVNSIRASAHAHRNERKVKLRRAQTAQDASLQGRSLRTLHQITHVEAIAASELERKRQKWLESEEKRKEEERTSLQNKVDHFIAKVESDKRRHRFGKSKITNVHTGIDATEAEKKN